MPWLSMKIASVWVVGMKKLKDCGIAWHLIWLDMLFLNMQMTMCLSHVNLFTYTRPNCASKIATGQLRCELPMISIITCQLSNYWKFNDHKQYIFWKLILLTFLNGWHWTPQTITKHHKPPQTTPQTTPKPKQIITNTLKTYIYTQQWANIFKWRKCCVVECGSADKISLPGIILSADTKEWV